MAVIAVVIEKLAYIRITMLQYTYMHSSVTFL